MILAWASPFKQWFVHELCWGEQTYVQCVYNNSHLHLICLTLSVWGPTLDVIIWSMLTISRLKSILALEE